MSAGHEFRRKEAISFMDKGYTGRLISGNHYVFLPQNLTFEMYANMGN